MTECQCIDVSWNDYEGPDLIDHFIRKARKEHFCIECGGTIKPGEKYEYVHGLWEGHWRTFKTCPACYEIRCEFFCRGYIIGQLFEDLESADLGIGELERLSNRSQIKLCEKL